MSLKRFSDHCPGCRPAIVDLETGEQKDETSPEMVRVRKAWQRTTYKQREVFHRVTCLNSRLPSDLRIFKEVTTIVQRALDPNATDYMIGELVEIPVAGQRRETRH